MQNVQMGIGMQMQMQTECPKCKGRGHIHKENCPICKGKKVTRQEKTITVNVPAGSEEGDIMFFKREAEQHPDHIAGDVVFTIKQKKDKKWSRAGANLYYKAEISLQEALLGVQ